MTRDPLLRRLKALIAFRVLFVTVLLGSIYLLQIGYGIFPYPFSILYLIIFLYALTIVYSFALDRLPGRMLAYAQLIMDVLSAMVLIFITGGVDSWFSWLLLVLVISATIVLDKRAGYTVAITASLLYGLLIDLQFYKLLPIGYDPNMMERDFLYKIFSHIIGMLLTAYLIGQLSMRLEEKSVDYEDLSRFNLAVIENTPSGLFTTDLDGKVVLFNRAAEDITGISRQEAVGKPAREIFPFLKSMEGRRRMEANVELNGVQKVIGLTTQRMLDTKGAEYGYIANFQDLTELKRMAAELRVKEKMAAVGELTANIAHEIRNPLASLRGSIEMLQLGAVKPEQRDRLMQIALGEMDRLNGIVTDFLEYSVPKPLEHSSFDINRALEETTELLQSRRQGEFLYEMKLDGPMEIAADQMKLKQVFWNLGLNAQDAMAGRAGGMLTVSTERLPGGVRIAFEDTGEGMPAEIAEKIFLPFFTTKRSGTGLGLSIAYRIIEDHGGKITVRSAIGKGTRFEIHLPTEEHA